MTIAVIEYTPETAHLMRSDYAARRARLYAVRPEPQPVEPDEPIVVPPEEIHDAIRDWMSLASPAERRPGSATRIIAMVSEATGVSRIDLISARRTINVVRPRQVCFYLMKTCTVLSYPEIGRKMGGRDHTTAIHGFRKITELMATNDKLRELVETLVARIQAEAA